MRLSLGIAFLTLGGALVGTTNAGAVPPMPLKLGLVGGPLIQRSTALLDLGLLPSGVTDLSLVVVNSATELRVIRPLTFGPVTAKWVDRENLQLPAEIPLGPGGIGRLAVSLDHAAGSGGDFTGVLLADNSGPLNVVVLDYFVVGAASLQVPISTYKLSSGIGKSFNDPNYSLCAGQSPPGYRLKPKDTPGQNAEFTIEGRERNCGKYARCAQVKRTNEDVCWEFSVQGDEAHDGEPHEIEEFNAYLKVDYEVATRDPVWR